MPCAMSGDCSSIATITPHVSASKPYLARVYPIPLTVSRTRRGMSMYVSVVISPATTTRPVVISVSQATRLSGSFASAASRTESEIWSAILSGCPSVTDSDVNRNVRCDIASRVPLTRDDDQARPRPVLNPVRQDAAKRRDPADEAGCQRRAGQPGELLEPRQADLDVEVRPGGGAGRQTVWLERRARRVQVSVGIVGDHERAIGAPVVEIDSAEVHDLQRNAVEQRRLGRRCGRVE